MAKSFNTSTQIVVRSRVFSPKVVKGWKWEVGFQVAKKVPGKLRGRHQNNPKFCKMSFPFVPCWVAASL